MKLNCSTRAYFVLQVITLTIIASMAFAAPEEGKSNTKPPSTTTDRSEYIDLPRNHWAYDNVHSLSRAGIIEGYEDGKFRGDQPMTRYEFAVAQTRTLPCSLGLASQSDVKKILDRLTALEDRFKALEDKINAINTPAALTNGPVGGNATHLDNELQAVQKEFNSVTKQAGQLITNAGSHQSNGAAPQ